VNEEQDKHLEH